MNDYVVLTAVGEDRPGLVDSLSSVLLENDLNIEDSRMSVLGGEFAIILLISGNSEAIRNIQQQKEQLEAALKLNLLIKATHKKTSKQGFIPYQIRVIGMDHPGIVHRLARFLSQHNINIEDLDTESYPAPHTGTPMFAVNMVVEIPSDLAIRKLRDEFISLCDERNLDADFEPLRA
ncbi:MAG: ACT domain-containing protein [Gammaproteobacteria bacterium]|nr:MAG: ACT domain-containing protein [Gammaproteobacteria bacterium]